MPDFPFQPEMPHKGGGSAGGGKSSSNIAFNKPKEASFISAIKAQVGYKEPTVDLEAKVSLVLQVVHMFFKPTSVAFTG